MSIPFTQYLLPHGVPRPNSIDMPAEVEALAHRFIEAGGWYECELLRDHATVSLTACWDREDGDNDIAIEIAPNGPGVAEAVERLVRKSVAYLEKGAA